MYVSQPTSHLFPEAFADSLYQSLSSELLQTHGATSKALTMVIVCWPVSIQEEGVLFKDMALIQLLCVDTDASGSFVVAAPHPRPKTGMLSKR